MLERAWGLFLTLHHSRPPRPPPSRRAFARRINLGPYKDYFAHAGACALGERVKPAHGEVAVAVTYSAAAAPPARFIASLAALTTSGGMPKASERIFATFSPATSLTSIRCFLASAKNAGSTIAAWNAVFKIATRSAGTPGGVKIGPSIALVDQISCRICLVRASFASSASAGTSGN